MHVYKNEADVSMKHIPPPTYFGDWRGLVYSKLLAIIPSISKIKTHKLNWFIASMKTIELMELSPLMHILTCRVCDNLP